MASTWLRKHGTKNLYRVEYRIGGRHGKTHIETGFLPKREATEAKDALDKRLTLQELAGRPVSGTEPVAVVLEKWKRSRLAGSHASNPWTENVGHVVGQLAEHMGWKNLADITAASLNAWIAEKAGLVPGMPVDVEAVARMATKGVRKPLGKVRLILRWAKLQGLTIDDAALGVRLGRAPRKRRAALLTVDEVTSILVHAARVGGFSFATMLEHIALYGCRPKDLCKLRVRNWDSAARTITYQDTKNTDDITHLVHEAHAVKLDRCAQGRGGDEPLFLDPWGKEWSLSKNGTSGKLTSWYNKNVGRVIVRDRPGMLALKRFGMTRLNKAAGGDRELVIKMSGHRDPKMVDVYTLQNEEGQAELIRGVPMLTGAAIAGPVADEPRPVLDMRPLITPDIEAVPMCQNPKIKRGFAALSVEKRREIAIKAYGKAVATGKLHRFTKDEARAAAQRGGFKPMDPIKRRFVQSIGGQTAKALGIGFDERSGKDARQAQLDAEPVVIEGLDDERTTHAG